MAYQPKSYRKFLAGTISAAVVASAIAPAASAAELKFKDTAGLDAETTAAIEALVGSSVIVGYPDGTFKPNQTINRGQAAEMIVKALPNVEPKANPTGKVFEDLTEKSYSSKFAEALVDAGLIPAGGKFGAGTGMTREAMAVTLVSAFGLKDNGTAVEVKDLDKAAEASRAAIKILAQHGLTKLLDGNFNPTADVTRSQFALFFYRAVAATLVTTEVTEIKSVNETTLEVKVKGSLTTVAPTDFTFDNGLTVTAAEIVPAAAADTFTTVKLTTSKQEVGKTYKLVTFKGAAVKTEVKFEIVAPSVASVTALNLKQVKVTFSTDVDADTAEATTNYKFNDSALSVTNAVLSGKEVLLTINSSTSNAAQQTVADLTVENVKDATGTVIGKTSKSVKFFDATAPEVASVSVAGPKTLKVKFSEPLKEAPNFSVNAGTTAIVTTQFTQGSDTVTLALGSQPTAGDHKLKVTGGKDYAGFAVEDITKDFTFGVDATAPTATIKSASPKKIVLEFSEDVTNVDSTNVQFYHTYSGIDAYKASKSLSGRELTLEFANPLPAGSFNLFLAYTDTATSAVKIADLWGNKLDAQTFTGTVVVDTVAPTITKVEANGNTQIKVTYSEGVVGADTLANYGLKDAAGNTVTLTSVAKEGNTNTYVVTTPALNGGSYTLAVKNVKDESVAQNKLADYSTTVSINDIVAPTVSDLNANVAGTQAQLLSAKKVKIAFSEVMDQASIENKLNYLFVAKDATSAVALDSKVTVTAADGNKSVILDFTNSTVNPMDATIQVLRVQDAAKNVVTAVSTDVLVPGTVSAPLFDRAEVHGKNTVKVFFKEVITGAVAADFLVDNGNGVPASVNAINNEVIDGKSVITLTTAGDLPTTADGVKVSTADTVSAKNGFGSAVTLTGVTAGDKYAPLATEAKALDVKDGASNGFVDAIQVTFSEGLYVPSVQEADFTVEGYEVTAVSTVGNVVTLTVKEKSITDVTATPKVTLVGSVEDTKRNVRTTLDAITAKSVSAQQN
jgi:trimeric autotransporter adhesin